MHYAETVTLQRDTAAVAWPALVELFNLTNLSGREGEKVRRAFEKSDLLCFAMDGSKLVGAARALTDFEYHATIYDVVVHPEYQGHSVGTRMMKELLSSLPVWRILLVADAHVRPFYERLGFEPFGDVLARLDRTRLCDS
ncbi:MAG TPA: GNAT family N-acetyltransferase [Steroidobacteraceae bacterium]|nr:GNAT family N-acetyltransferase [Steroidobacteraceae bacterium]